VPREEKVDFVPVPGVRTTTPETIVLGASDEEFARARAADPPQTANSSRE
jgi:hypothetical protein